VNQFAEGAIVAAISDGALEGPIKAAADRTAAQAIVIEVCISREDSLSANGTNLAVDRMNAGEAPRADGQAGNIQERKSANAAVRRK
jgi:hypothetical protein